jgi:hypothetical protein
VQLRLARGALSASVCAGRQRLAIGTQRKTQRAQAGEPNRALCA